MKLTAICVIKFKFHNVLPSKSVTKSCQNATQSKFYYETNPHLHNKILILEICGYEISRERHFKLLVLTKSATKPRQNATQLKFYYETNPHLHNKILI